MNRLFQRAAALLAALALLSSFAPEARGEDAGPPPAYADRLRLATRHREHRLPARAQNELLRAARMMPERPEAWLGLAEVALELGDDEGALLGAYRAMALAPGDATARAALGDAHARAGRSRAALHAYAEALRLAAAGSTLAAARRIRAEAVLEAARRADPGAVESAARAASQPGPVRRLLLRAFGRTERDAGRGAASLATGETLAPGCLGVLALDGEGFPVGAPLMWMAGEGLVVDAADRLGPSVTAGDRPCDSTLAVSLLDGSGATASIPLRVVGPLATLTVRPEKGTVQAGERLHLRAGASDAADHRLWLPELAWSLETDAAAPPARLLRSSSTVLPENFFEGHRNILDVPRENPPAPGVRFRLVVRDPAGPGKAEAAFEVGAGVAVQASDASGIAWQHDFDAATAEARERDLPLMVEVMSDW